MNIMTEICILCETGAAREVTADRSVDLNGQVLVVLADRFMKCDSCKEEYYTDEQSSEYSRKFNDARRRNEGLLTGGEIQKLRRSMLLSQVQLESALGVSKKTLVRWESGTAVQSKALDDVLRLVALDPDNLRLLVRIRHAALAPVVDEKLTLQMNILTGELKQAVYAGLERMPAFELNLNSSLIDEITDSVTKAILEHKRERVERSVVSSMEVAS
jgi:putative zinc finger/helix-turn-helix YgiT family protein